MKKLDEILTTDWSLEINIGMDGKYNITAKHWQHGVVSVSEDTLQNAISKVYINIWRLVR